MGKLWQVCLVGVLGIAFLVLVYLGFMLLALHTLETKYVGLDKGLTVEETDRLMGFLFRARTIDWDDIPEIFTESMDESKAGVIREYEFFGVNGLSIVVLYDREGSSYLRIPIYE